MMETRALSRTAPQPSGSLLRGLPPERYAALERFAWASGCAASTVVLAALVALFDRYAADDERCIETSVSAPRPAPPEPVALRVLVTDDLDSRALLERCRVALDADAERRRAAENPEAPSERSGSCSALVVRCADPHSLVYGVAVHCFGTLEALEFEWQYEPQQFDRAAILRIAEQFERLLEAVLAEPARPVRRAALLTAAERRDRIEAGHGERAPYEREDSIPELWARQVAATPNATALVDDSTHLTYAQVDGQANGLAHVLLAAGITPGARVGIAFDRSIDLPVALLATLKAGGVYVPLDLSYPRERLAAMIADAAIGVIVSRCALDGGLAFAGRIIRLDREPPTLATDADAGPLVRLTADSPAYITYTSGSTGRPKGVMVAQRGIARLVRGADYTRFRPDDGFLLHAPLAFDASTFEIWGPLLNGARLSIPRPGLLSVADLAEAIDRFAVTTLFLTTALFGRVAESGLAAFGRLRHLLTGGEVASPVQMCRFLAAYPDCRLTAVYGPTENTTFSTWHDLPTSAAVGSNVPIGRPIANSSAYVVDRCGEPVPVGVPGELWVGGDGVATGYLNLPQLSRERFVTDPFADEAGARVYKTGDRARWRADGVLEFLGRTDDQVKIRGFRIELGEIEAVLLAHPAVQAAAVVAAGAGEEKLLFAFIVRRDAGTVDEAALRMYLAAKLPRFMLPHGIRIVPALPERANGKVDRILLAARATTQPLPAAAPVSALADRVSQPDTGLNVPRAGGRQRQLQQTLAEIWRAALHRDCPPEIDENFFDAGGDSLRLLTVHSRLVNEFGANLPILSLFEHPTIRTLAAYLAAAGSP